MGRRVFVSALVAALAAMAYLVWGVFDPSDGEALVAESQSADPGRVQLAGTADPRRRESKPTRYASPDLLVSKYGLRTSAIEGKTPFTRRLSVGARLYQLYVDRRWRRIDDDLVASALKRTVVQEHLLRLDAWPEIKRENAAWEGESEIASRLRRLIQPRRDARGLKRSFWPADSDRLGGGSKLRVWTQKTKHPEAEVQVGAAFLDQLASVAGDVTPGGYDVFMSPKLGAELFPQSKTLTRFAWAAGVYVSGDDLSIVRSHLLPNFRVLVLKHELVHAWCAHHVKHWRSRFVSEGLAEYLSRLEPRDPGFRIPHRRFRHNLAALLRMLTDLDGAGIEIRSVPFDALVRSTPAQQYALGHLGYLLAQAAMVYIGPLVIEKALDEWSEAQLIDAIGRITWEDFRSEETAPQHRASS